MILVTTLTDERIAKDSGTIMQGCFLELLLPGLQSNEVAPSGEQTQKVVQEPGSP